MSRLRNRIVKAESWTDPDLCRMSRDKRAFYRSLWAMAEDSGCVVDDPFDWKMSAWSSPVDTDLTPEIFKKWRNELVKAGKLVPYKAGGKKYLFINAFHRHEHPRNPQAPNLPLPPWVKWEVHPSDLRKGSYALIEGLYNDATTLPVLPCPALPCPALPGTEQGGAGPDERQQAGDCEQTARPVPDGAKPSVPREVEEQVRPILDRMRARTIDRQGGTA